MLNHVARYDWHAYRDGLRPSVLGRAVGRKPYVFRNPNAPATAEADEAQPSAATHESGHAYVDALRAGNQVGQKPLLDKVVESWRADNAAGGRGVFEHMPLPNDLAKAMARLLDSMGETEKQSAFDGVISKLDPGVKTLVAQQLAGLMGRNDGLKHGEQSAHVDELGSRRMLDDELERSRFGVRQYKLEADRRNLSSGANERSLRGFGYAVEDVGALGPWTGRGEGASPRPFAGARGRLMQYDGLRDDATQVRTLAYDARHDNRWRATGALGPVSHPLSNGVAGQGEDGLMPTSLAGDQQSPYDPLIDDVAKDLQYYGYDPALLNRNMPGWRPIMLFDSRIPDGYSDEDRRRGLVRMNKKGFGACLAHRKGTRDFAIMIKGAEVSDLQWKDIEAAQYAGADQVAEVAEDFFQQCKRMGVFDSIKRGGRLNVIGHSQGAPSAQLLGVYLIVRAVEEGLLSEKAALAAISVRGFGGMGAKDYLDRLRSPDGSPLKVPPSVLNGIDAITYILEGDRYVQDVPVPYVGDVYLVDTPAEGTYRTTEAWAVTDDFRAHARSAYRAADYRTARRDTRERRGWRRAIQDKTGLTDAGDFIGDVVDRFTDWLY